MLIATDRRAMNAVQRVADALNYPQAPTCVCKRLDVERQVDVHTLCILHLLEVNPDEPH